MKSGNMKKVGEYFDNLKKKLTSQNVFQRWSSLWSDTMSGDISETQKIKYEKIDSTIAECMLAAEKKLVPPDIVNKSSKK